MLNFNVCQQMTLMCDPTIVTTSDLRTARLELTRDLQKLPGPVSVQSLKCFTGSVPVLDFYSLSGPEPIGFGLWIPNCKRFAIQFSFEFRFR